MPVNLGRGVQLELVWIRPGEFDMGSVYKRPKGLAPMDIIRVALYVNEEPVHRVKITQGFWLGKYEVTVEQYELIMGKRNSKAYTNLRDPVSSVTWNDAQEFLKKLNDMRCLPAGVKCRLPTEAEWEYACRGGTTTAYYNGDRASNASAIAWFGCGKLHPVGQKQPNSFGLYDMLGNADEWCADVYKKYSETGSSDQAETTTDQERVVRGGSCYSRADDVRVSARHSEKPSGHGGFRVCCSVVP